jgi:tRNA (guanine-N7-)-methyltransferase
MIWLDKLLESLPAGILQMVTIQFPDPWFKKKHAKRRMVNKELVETVVTKLAANGRIFVQTDIEVLADEIFELFEANEKLENFANAENPFPVKTERERSVEDRNLPIYRAMFQKNAEARTK